LYFICQPTDGGTEQTYINPNLEVAGIIKKDSNVLYISGFNLTNQQQTASFKVRLNVPSGISSNSNINIKFHMEAQDRTCTGGWCAYFNLPSASVSFNRVG
jgi:hypothetical protein